MPRILVNTTLNSEIYMFFNQKRSALLTKPINLDLFYEEKEQAFRKLLKITYPDPKGEIDNNYLYASCFHEMEDQNCYIFAVSDGINTRILGSEVIYGEVIHQNIQEVMLSNVELDKIISRLKVFYDRQTTV